MADSISTSKQLKLKLEFVDKDERTLTLDDPSEGLSRQDIVDVIPDIKDVFIGDQGGASFATISSADVVTKETTYLDIG